MLDPLSFVGLLFGCLAISLGQSMEGGHLSSLLNLPALVIVVGGTLGAVMLQVPFAVFVNALRRAKWVLSPPHDHAEVVVDKLVDWAELVRRSGHLALEEVLDHEADRYLCKGLQLVIDGADSDTLRACLERELETEEIFELQTAKVFESMGGYAPTVGILGAVLGLIQVMENLADPSRLGQGIAAAFVATVYGVGLANLLLLPYANKLKGIVRAQSRTRELMIDGLAAIAEGENPRKIRQKLSGYLG
jgi:chemotaxis protein MotA